MFFYIKYYIRYHVHYDSIFLLKTGICLNWEIDHKGFTPKCWQLTWESEIIGKFSFFFPVWPQASTAKLPGRFFSSLGTHIFRQEPLSHSLARNNTSNESLQHYSPIKAPRCLLPTLTASQHYMPTPTCKNHFSSISYKCSDFLIASPGDWLEVNHSVMMVES